MPNLSPVAAREIVHLLILRELTGLRRGNTITVKGGVNLRLFFGSPRYSEDMDLDGTAQASDTIRTTLKAIVEGKLKEAHVRALSITYAEYESQVVEFLGEEARVRYGTEDAWDEMRLHAAALIENVLRLQERL